jgi:hypothetical protein
MTFQPSPFSGGATALINGKKKKKSKGKSKPAPRSGSTSAKVPTRSALQRLEDPANRPADFKPLTGLAADTAKNLGLNIPIDPSYEIGSASAAVAKARAEGTSVTEALEDFEGSGGMGWLWALLGLGAAGGGAYYYLKVYKPKLAAAPQS